MRIGLSVIVALSVLAAVATAGDLVVKSTIESKGMVGMLDMQGTQQTTLSGDMMRQESNIRMTNKTMKLLGGGKPQETVKITRLDKQLFWDITPNDKSYTELTFADLRKQMTEGMAKAKEAERSDSVEMKTDIKVERTGKKQTIAGYEAEEVLVTMTMKGKNKETGESGEFKVDMDLWLSDKVPGLADYEAFQKKLAGELGGSAENELLGKALASLGGNQKELAEKVGDLKGYPLMSTVSAMPLSDSLANALKEARKQQAEAEQNSEVEEKSKETPAIDPTTASKGDAERAAAKALTGLFGKKKKDKKAAEAKSGGSDAETPAYVFRIVTTVTEISNSPASGASFDVPAGYTKK